MRESRYNVWVRRAGSAYVYNGLSGQLVKLGAQDAEAVGRWTSDGDGSGVDPVVGEQLVRARALIADDVDELEVLAARYARGRYDPSHLGLTLVTSLGCNFDCPYCYEDKHPSLLGPEVREAVLRLVDDTIERLEEGGANLRNLTVTWMGGEPLLGRESLYALSEAFTRRCDQQGATYHASIITNGWYLTDEVARRLAEHRVGTVQVTLDGPPDVHDRMRPHVNGSSTFWRLIENLHHAVEHIEAVGIRVNIDEGNLWRAEELLDILAAEGFAGKLGVACAKMTSYDDNESAPLATYRGRCYTSAEYAQVEQEFLSLARARGLAGEGLPMPTDAPCTAVAANEVVVGSEGELYKCWDDIGNPEGAIGDIRSYLDVDSRVHRWLSYSPFEDSECRKCIALPGCMGGCAHHQFAGHDRDDKCGTFRYTYQEQVARHVDVLEQRDGIGDGPLAPPLEMIAASRVAGALTGDAVPVVLKPRRGATVSVA